MTVQIEGIVIYSDGTVDQLTRVKKHGGFMIEPGQGFIISLLFLVPDDAAPGTAIFSGSAKVTKLSGKPNKSQFRHPIKVEAEAGFEVVEP